MSRRKTKEQNESEDPLEGVEFGDINQYTISRRLGRGKYSNVFKGYLESGKPCVVKVLKPVRPTKIANEISILKDLRGGPYTPQLLDIVSDPESRSIALVLDWSENRQISEVLPKMTTVDIAHYIKCVLEALVFAHDHGIMHRDVKPGNIMYDWDTKEVKLIDWGLAEYYEPGRRYPVRVATRHYKGPELLLNCETYGPSLDIWCLGCTLASLLFKMIPFFKGKDNDDQIVEMARVVGSGPILTYAKKHYLKMSDDLVHRVSNTKRKNWDTWIEKSRGVATPEAIDLLGKLLTVDHEMRPTAKEVLEHPFFDCLTND